MCVCVHVCVCMCVGVCVWVFADIGVVGGCGKICAALAEKTDQAIGTICTILCDIEGVEEFVKLIQK